MLLNLYQSFSLYPIFQINFFVLFLKTLFDKYLTLVELLSFKSLVTIKSHIQHYKSQLTSYMKSSSCPNSVKLPGNLLN